MFELKPQRLVRTMEEFMNIFCRRKSMCKVLEKKEHVEHSRSYRRTQRVLRAMGKVAGEKAECLGRDHILHLLSNFKDLNLF